MVLWGGLRPILSHAIIDLLALICLGYVASSASTSTSNRRKRQNLLSILFGTTITLIICSGWNFTNKWTMIFPMIPFVVLQVLRIQFLNYKPNTTITDTSHIEENKEHMKSASSKTSAASSSSSSWIATSLRWIIGFLSLLLIFLAAALTILFPTVELPLPNKSHDKYNVGYVDLFLPSIEWNHHSYKKKILPIPPTFDPNQYNNDHFAIRILYPTTVSTLDNNSNQFTSFSSKRVPYLRPQISKEFCEVNMKYGAPPPLQSFDWMVHNWRLIQLPIIPQAQLLVDKEKEEERQQQLPLIIYSPGLGGSSEMYSYQSYSLAAQGYVVVVVEHGDGSLAVLPQKDGTVFRRNDDQVAKDWFDGNYERHQQARKAMTEYRSEEILAATEYMMDLNTRNIPELESVGLSFVGRLNISDLHYMGHSFGGASSFHAARKQVSKSKRQKRGTIPRPRSVIAHEPASDWIPDASRGSLFDRKRLKNSSTNYTFWTSDVTDQHSSSTSIHDDLDLLVLFSHEWSNKKWGGSDVLQDMYQRGLFGRRSSLQKDDKDTYNRSMSRVEVIDSAHHIEFSDIAMITPTWLARAVGLTGEKNPQHTAKDIHLKTLDFLNDLRRMSTNSNPVKE